MGNLNALMEIDGERKRESFSLFVVLYNTTQNACLTTMCSILVMDTYSSLHKKSLP